jgi:hypothetical protein
MDERATISSGAQRWTISAIAREFPPYREVLGVTHETVLRSGGDYPVTQTISYPSYAAARAALPRGLRAVRPSLSDADSLVAAFRGRLRYEIHSRLRYEIHISRLPARRKEQAANDARND